MQPACNCKGSPLASLQLQGLYALIPIVHGIALESTVVYLRSPRRRGNEISIRHCIGKYRCEPKIASPEARNRSQKTFNKRYPRGSKSSPKEAQRRPSGPKEPHRDPKLGGHGSGQDSDERLFIGPNKEKHKIEENRYGKGQMKKNRTK